MKKERNPLLVEDDRWKKKGGAHKLPSSKPKVCPDCKGLGRNEMGVECFSCCGEGEIYE